MKKTIFLIVFMLILYVINGFSQNKYTDFYKFADLPYSTSALEPYIDSTTVSIHYFKHHYGYYKKFIKLMNSNNFEPKPLKYIFTHNNDYPKKLINMAGGYWNHTFFWQSMTPKKTEPSQFFVDAIEEEFGSWNNFEKQFKDKAKSLFGSGWTWLIFTKKGHLKIVNTPNQDNPLMQSAPIKGIPLLAIDVWEHAYYLKYQNRRADYINNFWEIINWEQVSNRYQRALLKTNK